MQNTLLRSVIPFALPEILAVPAQPNQSLHDGILLLGLLCSNGRLGTTEAAQALGWEVTRVNRLLGTLRDLGLAEQDRARKYLPGHAIHVLAAQCLRGSGLLSASLAVLKQEDRDGFGVALGVLWQGTVTYLLHVDPGEPVELGVKEYTPYPANQSSIGLVLEAFGAAETPSNSVASIERTREDGYAIHYDDETRQTGSVAVVIPGGPGLKPIAGLAWYGRLTTRGIPKIVERLRAQSARIAELRSRHDLEQSNA